MTFGGSMARSTKNGGRQVAKTSDMLGSWGKSTGPRCACAAAMATAAQEREGEGHTKIPTQDDWKGDRHIHEPNTVDILTR